VLLLSTHAISTALAHSKLVSSNPAAGSTVSAAPREITVVFSEEIDPAKSHLWVGDVQGRHVDNGDGRVDLIDPDRKSMFVSLPAGLGNGVYTVWYHTFTADDGGVVDGLFRFGVNASVPELQAQQAAGSGADAAPPVCASNAVRAGSSSVTLEGLVAMTPQAPCPSMLRIVLNYGPTQAIDVSGLSPSDLAGLGTGRWVRIEATRSGDGLVAQRVAASDRCEEGSEPHGSDALRRCHPGSIHGTPNAGQVLAEADDHGEE
jgi:methionine-rich copper-binding protein CopC